MNKRIILWVALFALFTLTQAWAETSIKADVDRKSLTTDETLTYKITITSSENRLPEPEVPEFEGFSITSQANSSTISYLKSQIKTILVYVFILTPNSAGKFTIGPATIKVKDKTYSSEAFEIEVRQGKAIPKPLLQETEPQISL